MAEAAANRARPEANAIKSARCCESWGFSIAKRLTIIQADMWEKEAELGAIFELDFLAEPDSTTQAQTTIDLVDSLSQAGHRLVRVKRGFQCLNCRAIRALKNFSHWSRNPCKPRPPANLIIQQRKIVKAKILQARAISACSLLRLSKMAKRQGSGANGEP